MILVNAILQRQCGDGDGRVIFLEFGPNTLVHIVPSSSFKDAFKAIYPGHLHHNHQTQDIIEGAPDALVSQATVSDRPLKSDRPYPISITNPISIPIPSLSPTPSPSPSLRPYQNEMSQALLSVEMTGAVEMEMGSADVFDFEDTDSAIFIRDCQAKSTQNASLLVEVHHLQTLVREHTYTHRQHLSHIHTYIPHTCTRTHPLSCRVRSAMAMEIEIEMVMAMAMG